MTYSIGTAHVLTGTGQVSITSPIGLKVALTNVPARAGRLAGHLPEYYGLGRLAVGNADGFLPALYLKHASGLFYPLPDSLSLLEYTVSAGVTATVTELTAGAVPNWQKQPFDRNPSQLVWDIWGGVSGGTADTVVFTFTVPAGRILSVASMNVHLIRETLATSINYAQAYITVGGSFAVRVVSSTNVIGADHFDGLGASPLWIPPGTVVAAHWSSADTGGLWWMGVECIGTYFDL